MQRTNKYIDKAVAENEHSVWIIAHKHAKVCVIVNKIQELSTLCLKKVPTF